MVHVAYSMHLVLLSVFVAIVASYVAIAVEQLIYRETHSRFEKTILVVSGLSLGLAIWLMHFIGMLACHLPSGYYFQTGLTILSYFIAAVASILAIWLNTRPTLPLSRLIIGSVLMGFGIAGMHYTGMMALVVPGYSIDYDPLIVLFSVIIGILGSAASFYLAFKFKDIQNHRFSIRFFIALVMVGGIIGLHYTGMNAVYFMPIDALSAGHIYQSSPFVLSFTIIFVAALILLAGFFVAALELRLEEKDKAVHRLNLELSKLAVQDHLTKLPNRIYLEDNINTVFTQHRMEGKQLGFLYLDLDRFKMVNEVFGHQTGDQLMVEVVTRVHKIIPPHSRLIRLTGDEFLLIVEDTQLTETTQIAEQLIEAVKHDYYVEGKAISLSASIGIAIYPDHGQNFKDLLISADMAMFLAKEQGRNTYRVFNNTLDAKKAKSEFQLANDLNHAIEYDQLIISYQPKFNQDLNICGVEALIRWNHPNLGILGPQMFIDLAERTGFIVAMGYWVLEEACKQIKDWEGQEQRYYPVAVNLSAMQFEHSALFSRLQNLIKKYAINPHHLIIEVTETTAMKNVELCVPIFKKLRELGIQIAIDDFGTGYSSFSHLKDLPLDELKIDKVFIVNLRENSKEEKILASIIHLAIDLGLTVTAEGVETRQQAEILLRLGCHQMQGFLYGKPMLKDELKQYKGRLQGSA